MKRLAAILVLVILAALACTFPGASNTANLALTAAAETVSAQLTLNAQGQPTNTPEPPPDQPTNTPEPPADTDVPPTNTTEPTNTAEPTSTKTPQPCDKSEYIKDVTIPDGTELLPGETFTKTWRIKNVGTCTWNSGYDIVFGSGDKMDGPTDQQITTGEVPPNGSIDISIDLTAPLVPGDYKGIWHLRNDDNVIFTTGGFWVDVEVVEPAAFSNKSSFQIDQTFQFDLDNGSSPATGVADMKFDAVSNDNKSIVLRNGAKMRVMGSGKPEYGDCATANLNTTSIKLDQNAVGKWVCYITNEGRLGRFKILSLKPTNIAAAQVLEINYVTWELP